MRPQFGRAFGPWSKPASFPAMNRRRRGLARVTARTCAACGQRISLTEVEFEVDVAGTTLRLHRLCHQFWLEQCEPIKGR